MSLVKSKSEIRTILDFSQGEVSKNSIRRALRQVEITQTYKDDSNLPVMISNQIKIGIYTLVISFGGMPNYEVKSLGRCGKLHIVIYEQRGSQLDLIGMKFKNQYWSKLNLQDSLKANHLIDVILHLKRLNNLKVFL
jgi:hypothetical protein